MSKLLVVMINVSKLFKRLKFEDYNDPLKVFSPSFSDYDLQCA